MPSAGPIPRALLFSERLKPLVYVPNLLQPAQWTILTVENYSKWYALYAVKRDYSVQVVEFSELEKYCHADESAYCDHVPNPAVTQRMCVVRNWKLDDVSYEVMIGRWEREYKENEAY